MKNKDQNLILKMTFDFSCNVIEIYKQLNELKMYRIADQLCRSGTSIGANVREAQRAVSRPDFINKLGIALKEAEETQYWFEIIEAKFFRIEENLKGQIISIIKVLTSIINTVRSNPAK